MHNCPEGPSAYRTSRWKSEIADRRALRHWAVPRRHVNSAADTVVIQRYGAVLLAALFNVFRIGWYVRYTP